MNELMGRLDESTSGELAGRTDSLPRPAKPEWRCFHCNQVFDDFYAAQRHFGERTTELPECYPYLATVRKLTDEVDLWKSRYEAERQAHEATIAHCDDILSRHFSDGNDGP